ncbi:MAG TPA: ABC transporter permease [Gemmatimonadaceae bacterium]|nr:ABC transporter permease [Gemmatimonadaceae bacterium]
MRQASMNGGESDVGASDLDDAPDETSAPIVELGGRFLTRRRLVISSAYWLTALVGPRSSGRAAPVAAGVTRELDTLGFGAIRLVGASALLVGLITVFQVAYQLAPYGAEVVSIRAVAWFVAREIGPIVVAILVVARSAAAIAGEFASMSTNGEIDALRAMGLDPVKYLVVPKLAALLIALPALTSIAIALAIVGGWMGTSGVLGFNTGLYLEQLHESLAIRDVGVGLAKSVLFAIIIGLVAADEGLSVDRRVSAIGHAATRAVVHCLLGVLAADTFVNVVVYFIPGLT